MHRPFALAAAVTLAACSGAGNYVRIDDYAEPPRPSERGYVIAPGDVLNVRVYNQEGMSAKVRVRPDGRISLPFLNDVEAAGYTPSVLGQQVQTRLKDFVNVPIVTVSLEEPHQLSVSLVGEVARPGEYKVDPETRLVQALALAGGLTEYAHKDRLYVLRQAPSPARIRFSWDDLIHEHGKAPLFHLQGGDVIVVE